MSPFNAGRHWSKERNWEKACLLGLCAESAAFVFVKLWRFGYVGFCWWIWCQTGRHSLLVWESFNEATEMSSLCCYILLCSCVEMCPMVCNWVRSGSRVSLWIWLHCLSQCWLFRLLKRRCQDEFFSCSSGGWGILASWLVAMFVDSEIKPSSQGIN